MVDPTSVAFALITFYPYWYPGKLENIKNSDKIRGDIALEFIGKAKRIGYHVVVVDGKSYNSFHAALQKILGITLLRRESDAMAPAKRLAFRSAAHIPGVKAIVATEPEKVSIIDSTPAMVQPILDGKADIVVPHRDPELFRTTYPDFQYLSESEGNRRYNQKLRQHGLLNNDEDLDVFFGPRVFSNTPDIVKLVSLIPSKPRGFSQASALALLAALKKKFRVTGVEIVFQYPKIQKQNELAAHEFFEEKRKKQTQELLSELTRFLA